MKLYLCPKAVGCAEIAVEPVAVLRRGLVVIRRHGEQRVQQLKSEQESSAQAHSRLREEYKNLCRELERSQSERSALQDEIEQAAVSYTHLTLPTKA